MENKLVDEAFFENLDQLEIYLKDNVAGAFGGNHKSKKTGSSSEFADFREYIPGDDIRRIDWNVYSRFEKLYLKLFLDERQMHIRIYLDCSKSMEGKAEAMLKLAAAFAYMAINAMDKVTIFAIHGHKCEKVINKIVGKEAYFNSIAKLNDIKFEDDSFISDAVLNGFGTGYGNGMSFIMSDFLTENDYRSCIGHLRDKHRDVTCVQLLTKEEVDPYQRGKSIFFDSEVSTKQFKRNITRDQIRAYKSALDFLRKDIEHFCTSRGANYLFAQTDTPVDRVILNDAVKREVVK